MLQTLADGVHCWEGPQSFLGLELGSRMTILELDGGVLLHSPMAVEPDRLGAFGSPRWVLAPNTFHHLHVGPWLERGAEGWAAPGLEKKREDLAFSGVVAEGARPFGDEVDLYPLRCFSLTNEVVLHHRPSRTLVVTDLVFNLAPTAPWLTRASFRCLCGYPGCKTTLLERVGMTRSVARAEVGRLLELDFDRLVMAHGDPIETGGKQALRDAFGWLLS